MEVAAGEPFSMSGISTGTYYLGAIPLPEDVDGDLASIVPIVMGGQYALVKIEVTEGQVTQADMALP